MILRSDPLPGSREERVETLLALLKDRSESSLRAMAERLADLPEDQSFGRIEHDLVGLARKIASDAHQAGLDAGKKRGTPGSGSPAPSAGATRASSATAASAG